MTTAAKSEVPLTGTRAAETTAGSIGRTAPTKWPM